MYVEREDTSWAPLAIVLTVLVVALLMGYFLWYQPNYVSASSPDHNVTINNPAPAPNVNVNTPPSTPAPAPNVNINNPAPSNPNPAPNVNVNNNTKPETPPSSGGGGQ